MSGTARRTFSLPEKHAEFIDAKVRSGDYASGSEVVRAGLRALLERDEAVERWLREEVVPAYDSLKEGRAKTYSGDEVLDRIRARHNDKMNKS